MLGHDTGVVGQAGEVPQPVCEEHVQGDIGSTVALSYSESRPAQTVCDDEHERGHDSLGYGAGHAHRTEPSLGGSCGAHATDKIAESFVVWMGGSSKTSWQTRTDLWSCTQKESRFQGETA